MSADGAGPAGADYAPTPSVVVGLRREDAARACGVSEELFDAHIRPTLPVVRLGSVRVYPITALQAWLVDHVQSPADELERMT